MRETWKAKDVRVMETWKARNVRVMETGDEGDVEG